RAGGVYLYPPDLRGPPRWLPPADPKDGYSSARFVSGDHLLVATSPGGYFGLCQVGKDQAIRKILYRPTPLNAKVGGKQDTVVISRAGVIVWAPEGVLRLFDYATGREAKKILIPEAKKTLGPAIRDLSASADGKFLAAAVFDPKSVA